MYGGSQYITNSGEVDDLPHILIATPGRLWDLIDLNAMKFDVSELKYLVVDEADRILCDHRSNICRNFIKIVKRLPSNQSRQTLLFSATLDKSMTNIYKALQYRPRKKKGKKKGNHSNEDHNDRVVFIETSIHKLSSANNIQQRYCFVPEMTKEAYLVVMCMEMEDIGTRGKSVILFFATKEYCMVMARVLRHFRLKVAELHANMKQRNRTEQLMRFRSGKSNILVATDVASRGLDIPQVE